MADKFHLGEIQAKLKASEREVLVLLSNQAQNYFVRSFKKQGFNGVPWKEVQRRDPDKKAYKYPTKKGLQRRTSPILVGAGYKKRGGELMKAVGIMARTSQVGKGVLRMVVNVPYAKYHNEGAGDIPKRQFIGQTRELTAMQTKEMTRIIDKIWQV